MSADLANSIWAPVSAGRHVLVRGDRPAPPAGWLVVEVDCADRSPSADPLREAVERIHAAIGSGGWHGGSGSTHLGPAHHLLDEHDVVPVEVRFVEACNSLAEQADQPGALLLASLEHASEATIETLATVFANARWLVLPLVLQVAGGAAASSARIAGLEDAVERAGGVVVDNRADAARAGEDAAGVDAAGADDPAE